MKKTIVLETERLVLRKIKKDDYKAIFDNWASDSEVAKYLTWNAHKNYEDTKKLVNKWLCDYEKDYTFRWIVTLKDDNTPIGMIDLINVSIGESKAEIGYCYGRKWWGNGYATEALTKVLEYVSSEIEYLYAMYVKENPVSGKVMQKAGMSYAGCLKLYAKVQGFREDVHVYYYISKK